MKHPQMAVWVLVLALTSCGEDPAGPLENVTLLDLAGTCVVKTFEFRATGSTARYDGAANGYRADLTITASSADVGTYAFVSTAEDPIGVNDDDDGPLIRAGEGVLRFGTEDELPGDVAFTYNGRRLTLQTSVPDDFEFTSGQAPATVRVVCEYP